MSGRKKTPASTPCTRLRPGLGRPVRATPGWMPPRANGFDGGQRRHRCPDLLEKLLAGAERSGAELVLCNCCPVTEDGAEHPLPADEQFAKETVLDVNAFWDAFNTPWINQFTGTAHRLYAAKLFDGVRYPLGMLHEDYYVLPDLIARCTKFCACPLPATTCCATGSITDGAKHEVRLAMTKGISTGRSISCKTAGTTVPRVP